MFDGIIFDVDGTLWDSTPVVERAWNKALEDFGYTDGRVSAEILRGLFGLPMYAIIDSIAPGMSDAKKEEFAPKCYEYEHAFLDETPGYIYDGILDTIRELAKTHRIFIVSNCQAGYIELFLRKSGLADVVIDHLCPGDTNEFKAANIRRIVKKHGLSAPVYVGDTQMDADACEEAGVPMIYAEYGFGSVRECYAKVKRPADLIDVVR